MKILIVEDERKTGEYLCMGLREAGYAVELLNNGVDGLHQALEGDHDLIILDVMLPGMDGWQVLIGLRAQGREMPVLFLTAKNTDVDRLAGLRHGDVILSIDGKAIAARIDLLRALVRCEPGDQLQIRRRGSDGSEQEVTLLVRRLDGAP